MDSDTRAATEVASKATFILVHGGWHGAWCWEDVSPALREAGHRVVAVDLPGHGDDPTPIAIVTRESYIRRIVDAIDPAAEPAILVGHSMGGILITQAAETAPKRLAALVYIAAFVPRSGEVMSQIVQMLGADSMILDSFIVDAEKGTTSLRPDAIRDLFYGDCDPDVAARAEARSVPECTSALGGEVTSTDPRAGSVPRYYVKCLRDRALELSVQDKITADGEWARIFAIDSDHSPFYSGRDDLVRALLDVADGH